jgi:hypothetical protein
VTLKSEEDDDGEEQAIESERAKARQQFGFIPLPTAPTLTEGAREITRNEWYSKKDGNGLGDSANRKM